MWIARAPELEEDVALGNIALDLIGHARSLLHYAGTATGRSEDDLAYWRDEPEWRNAWLFEQPNGDFAHTIARQLVGIRLPVRALRRAHRVDRPDARGDRREVGEGGRLPPRPRHPVGAAARRRHRRVAPPHDPRDHRHLAVRRRAVPRRRARRAPRRRRRRGAAVDAAAPRSTPRSTRCSPRRELELPTGRTAFTASGGGRDGKHTEHLGPLLAEMQVLARAAPGGIMVTAAAARGIRRPPVPADPAALRAWQVAATVTDPEVPVLTIEDLGVLRSVEVDDDGAVLVKLTPTYSGCPALDAMRDDVLLALTHAGYSDVRVDLVLAPAWTTDWMSDEGKAEAAQVRHPGADRARRGSRLGAGPAAARREVPALRLAEHARARPLRLDVVQGALRVPRLPRAVRLLQGALMAARNLGSTATPAAARLADSSVAETFLASTVGGEHVAKRHRARFHALEVAEVRPLTADAVEVTFTVPEALADDYTYLPGQYVALRTELDGHERRRSYSICRPPERGQPLGRDQARPRRGVLDVGEHRAEGRRHARRDEPAGHVHVDARRARRQARRRHRRGLGHHPAHGARRTRCWRGPRHPNSSSSTRTGRRST